MNRIIFVPQYPTSMRYQEWWFWKFPEEFKKAGFEVLTLGERYAKYMEQARGEEELFSPIDLAIKFELEQIAEFIRCNIRKNDILFLADLSFPGIFTNILYHKSVPKTFAFCHATSLNYLDYFEKVRENKSKVEAAHASMMNKVFVGSEYHQQKLNWKNTEVTYLPYSPFVGKVTDWKNKKYDIVSVSRNNPQKIDLEFEAYIEKVLKVKIKRKKFTNWNDYFNFISEAKILLISSKEETFGYQVVDAVMNNCIPLTPSKFSYPELLPPEFMYSSKEEVIAKIDYIINSTRPIPQVPELICHGKMKNFYRNIIEIMKKE